ncbi:IS5 family transposase [Streptomyces sp. T-3]|nr:IS5 family transposase [Streptomyces sp. T-3]
MITVHGLGRSHGRAVGGAGAVVAEGDEGGTAARLASAAVIDGIRFRVRTGIPWRDVPVEYGPWGRIYDLFRRWQRDGTWHQILTHLQSLADAKGAITWDLSVDSTVCRAHQHAAGAHKQGDRQKEPPGGVFDEPRDHGLGRSRGGFTTKLHLAIEQGQKPMSIVVTAGQRGDSPQFEPVLDKVRVPRTGPGRPRVRPNRVRHQPLQKAPRRGHKVRARGPLRGDRPRSGHQRVAVTTALGQRLSQQAHTPVTAGGYLQDPLWKRTYGEAHDASDARTLL